METDEMKRQIIEMIESIDDEELLYLVKEDIVFHVTSKAMSIEGASDTDAIYHEFNNYSIAAFGNIKPIKD